MPEATSANLETFIDKLMVEIGYEALPDAVKTEMREDLLSRAEQKLNASLIAAIQPEDLDGLNALLDDEKTPNDKVHEFFASHIDDLEGVVASALMEFRSTLIK